MTDEEEWIPCCKLAAVLPAGHALTHECKRNILSSQRLWRTLLRKLIYNALTWYHLAIILTIDWCLECTDNCSPQAFNKPC